MLLLRKMMAFAGISDCFTCSCGHTRRPAPRRLVGMCRDMGVSINQGPFKAGPDYDSSRPSLGGFGGSLLGLPICPKHSGRDLDRARKTANNNTSNNNHNNNNHSQQHNKHTKHTRSQTPLIQYEELSLRLIFEKR